MGREADAARSGAGVTTCCPPRLTQPLLCATHCWGGVSTVGRGQTRCLSRSVAWLRGQRVTTQSPSPMVSKGSNLEEENESGGVFNKYSVANLDATGTQRDEMTAGAGGAACPVCLHRQAAGPAASPGCGGSAFPRRRTPPDPRALVVCPEFHAGRRRPAPFSPPSSSHSTRTPRSLGHLSSHCSGGLARPRASRSRLDARSSPPSTAQRPGEVASGAKSRLSEPEGLPGPWGLQPQATAAELLLPQLPR